MSPFILIGLLAAGAYVVTSNPSKPPTKKLDCGCGKFRPIFKLSEDCTQILGLDPIYVNNPNAVKTDNNKIHSYINSKKKDFDIWKATEDILIQRYGEKCYKASEKIYNLLFISQFSDIARVLYLYDHVDCWNYDQLIFGDLRTWIKSKNLFTEYKDNQGISLTLDKISDDQIIEELLAFFKLYPGSDKKENVCLAIPLYFGSYLVGSDSVFMYDYAIASVESDSRWKRLISIVDKAKESLKKGGKK